MIQDIKEQVRYFIANKIYMLSLLLAAIAGYGYEVTHSTMGIDDVCIELYFEDGLGVAIGRWPFYLINKVFCVTDFKPFLLDFIAVLLMVGAAILFSALIRYVVNYDVPIFCYTIFSILFLTYSLIAEIFIFYLQNGVPIIYCLVAIALFIFYYVQTNDLKQKERIKGIIVASLIMCVAIGFYESAANLFLFGVFLMMLGDFVSANRLKLDTFRNCFATVFLMVRILIYGIVARSIMTKLCMWIFDIAPHEVRSMGQVLWIIEYPGRIVTILKQIIRDYFIVGMEHYPIMLFVVATVMFFGGLLFAWVKKKSGYVVLIGLAAYASLFVLSFFQGDAVPYRANQMAAVFVAFTFFVLSYFVIRMPYILPKSIGILLLISVVYNSVYDLNQWFAFDYKRNQIELDVIHQVAHELETGGFDIENKPVVFVGEYRTDEAVLNECSLEYESLEYELVKKINESMDEKTPTLYPYVQVLPDSLINWGMEAFYIYEGYNREMIRIFEKAGCSLIYGGNELYQKGVARITEQERYPVDGYIKEYHDCIIVRF